jgi:hypothetical protein
MVTYEIHTEWTYGGNSTKKGLTWLQVLEYLTGIYQTAQNEQVFSITIKNEELSRPDFTRSHSHGITDMSEMGPDGPFAAQAGY